MKIDPVAAQKELDAIEAKRAADKAVADKAAEEAQRAAAKTPAADAEDAKDGGKDDAEEDANGNKKAKTSDEAPVTRAELAGLIASAVVEAMKQNSAPVVAAPAAAEQAAPAVAAAPAAAAAPASITREDLTAALADVLKPVTERLERIEGTTVVRSAGNDGEPAKAEPAKTEQNVFRGAFGNLGAAPKE